MMFFESYNCDKCVKSSSPIDGGERYTNADKNNVPKCSIQRDYVLQSVGGVYVNERTCRVCDDFLTKGIRCPFLKEQYNKRTKKVDKRQLRLFDVSD